MKARTFLIAASLVLLSAISFADEREESELFRTLGNAVHVSNAADLLSTEILLSRGGTEKNPALRNRAVRTSIKVVAPFVVNHLTAKIYDKSPTTAILVRLGATCAFTYAASRNLQLSYSISF